jgi:hypothetical protein
VKKFFWFAVGVGVTVLVVTKGRQIMEKVTPKGVAEQAQRIGRRVEDQVIAFMESVGDNMAAREAELREALDLEPEER